MKDIHGVRNLAEEFRNRVLTYVVSSVLRFLIKFDTCQKVSASDIEMEKLWKQSGNLSRQFERLSAVSRKEHMSEQVNLMLKSSGDKIGILNRLFEPLRTVAKCHLNRLANLGIQLCRKDDLEQIWGVAGIKNQRLGPMWGPPVAQEGRFGADLGVRLRSAGDKTHICRP